MGRAPCCDKATVKKGPWSPEEDATLKSYIEQHGTGGNWIALPHKIGLKRCGKSCRLRWLNYLRPDIKHGGFSEEEDRIICSLYITIGSRWSIIAAQLPGRTDNDIKNYWNTRLKKKLFGKPCKDQRQDAKAAKSTGNQIVYNSSENIIGGVACTAATVTGSTNSYWPNLEAPIYDKFGSSWFPATISGESMSYASIAPPVQSGPVDVDTQGPNGFESELDEIFRFGTVKSEGLDCLYGESVVSAVTDESTATSASESANWGEVSALVYPDAQPCSLFDQGMQQHLMMQ